nr:MAG TPA: hypothetical protein [Siphoviridae sp. ctDlU28]
MCVQVLRLETEYIIRGLIYRKLSRSRNHLGSFRLLIAV